MKKKTNDRHLGVPAEANRDKHLNFVALENGDTDPADVPPEGKLTGKKSPGNKKKEKSRNK